MDKDKASSLPPPQKPPARTVFRQRLVQILFVLSVLLFLMFGICLILYTARGKSSQTWGRFMWNQGYSTFSFVTVAEEDLNGYTVLMIGGTSPLVVDYLGSRKRKSLGFAWHAGWPLAGNVWQFRVPYWFLLTSTLFLAIASGYMCKGVRLNRSRPPGPP